MEMTITEALSELNLISKKIEKKQAEVLKNLVRWEHVKDPLEKEGGSQAFVGAEIQAIQDLRERYVKIRSAIAKANTETAITINGKTKTINEWLNWKRDISNNELAFATTIHNNVKSSLDQQANSPKVIKDDAGNMKIISLVTNVEYGKFLKEAEAVSDTLETLDGKLSLKNATIMIEV